MNLTCKVSMCRGVLSLASSFAKTPNALLSLSNWKFASFIFESLSRNADFNFSMLSCISFTLLRSSESALIFSARVCSKRMMRLSKYCMTKGFWYMFSSRVCSDKSSSCKGEKGKGKGRGKGKGVCVCKLVRMYACAHVCVCVCVRVRVRVRVRVGLRAGGFWREIAGEGGHSPAIKASPFEGPPTPSRSTTSSWRVHSPSSPLQPEALGYPP